VFLHLDEPDAYDEKSVPQYKLTLKFPKEPGADADATEEEIVEFLGKIDEAYERVCLKHRSIWENPVKDGDDKENEKSHGFYLLTPHTSKPVPVVDSRKREIDPKTPWGGDLVRCVIDFTEVPAKKKGAKASFTPYLTLVQLLEKRALTRTDEALAALEEWQGGGGYVGASPKATYTAPEEPDDGYTPPTGEDDGGNY
jgi:hypothetical protein